jgi:hypothetical protein
MVSGSERVETTFLLTSEIEYNPSLVRSILKNSVVAARFISRKTPIYTKNR